MRIPTVLRIPAFLLSLSFASTSTLAQETAKAEHAVKFRITSGALLATGEQRSQLKDAQLTGAQLSWNLNRHLALNGTFSWARSRDLGTSGTPKLDVFTSDIGAEMRSGEWLSGSRTSARAFAGGGVGMRSYNYRRLDVPATNNLAGYISAGGEFAIGRVGLRLEARDYLTGFRPLVGGGESTLRNDIVLTGALQFKWHRAAK